MERGGEGAPCRPVRVNASKQAINNLLAQLEHAGYLTRLVNPDNRRERTIELTTRGHAAIETIRAAVQQMEERSKPTSMPPSTSNCGRLC
jgi:DNA-binding PadR family transcriptional regulator